MFPSTQELPVTKLPADATYHQAYPNGVTVSEAIHPRAIEPIYDILDSLTNVNATVEVTEMDQGGPYGDKGSIGCTGIRGYVDATGAPGIGQQAALSVKLPDPRDHGRTYGLEELKIIIRWTSKEESTFHAEPLVLTPYLATCWNYQPAEPVICREEPLMVKDGTVSLLLTKPLFHKVLTAYQTEHPEWEALDLYQHLKQQVECSDACDSTAADADWGLLDRELVELVTGKLSDQAAILQTVTGRTLLDRTHQITYQTTGKVLYHYTIILQAPDLAANLSTIKRWVTLDTHC